MKEEKELWKEIEELRERMVNAAQQDNGNLLNSKVLEISEELNKVLVEYQKILHDKRKIK